MVVHNIEEQSRAERCSLPPLLCIINGLSHLDFNNGSTAYHELVSLLRGILDTDENVVHDAGQVA